MQAKVERLQSRLNAAKDGIAACNAINALEKLAEKGDTAAKQALAEYMLYGTIAHMRVYACASLAGTATTQDVQFVPDFLRGLSIPQLSYWSVQGFVRTASRHAYAELVRLAGNKKAPLDVRCHAVKCLAESSKQPFDRNLPSDPGYWKVKDLRLDELAKWSKDGYPEGAGYQQPRQHPALKKPKTDFEKTVAALDLKVKKSRTKSQNPAVPTDWLAIAGDEDLQHIKDRWNLPTVYLDFLTRFSPIRVTLQSRRFYNHFQLFGAGELIDAQDGYSYDSVRQRPLRDWPAHRVVVANHGGDPFVLDLSRSDGQDAPVDSAEHGAGEWNFVREADSFSAFLKSLAR